MQRKRLRLLGICLVAALALGAMIASTAQAGEYGVCVKAAKVGKPAKFIGHYTNKACTKRATVAQEEVGKENKFEWYPGLTGIGQEKGKTNEVKAANFEGTTKTKFVRLDRSARGEITCREGTGTYKILGVQSDEERFTYTVCGLSAGRCGDVGEPYGPLETFKLDSFLIDHGTKGPGGLEPKEGEVWNELQSSEDEPYQAIFECAPGLGVRMSGTLSGVVGDLNVMSAKGKTTFSEAGGEQDLVAEVFEGYGWESVGPNVEIASEEAASVSKGKVEIRACNEPGAVSEGKEDPPCEHEEPLPW